MANLSEHETIVRDPTFSVKRQAGTDRSLNRACGCTGVFAIIPHGQFKQGVAMKCAYCGGGNAEESQNCRTCGTPLTKEAAAAQAPPAFSPEAKRLMTRGALWFGGGVLITVITYSAASGGGTYVVAWGAMIVGAVNFFRGLTARNKFTQSSNPMETIVEPSPDPQELLDSAARLESVNREQAVAKYQEIIKGFPGTRESEEAQRNIRLLTSHREE